MPLVRALPPYLYGIAPGKRRPSVWSVHRNPRYGDMIVSNAAAAYTRSTKVVSFKRVIEDGAEYIYAITDSGSEYMLPVDAPRHGDAPHFPVEWLDVSAEYLSAEGVEELAS